MKSNLSISKLAFYAVIGCIMLTGCPRPAPEPEPRFTAFGVTPQEVCLNVGVPVARVTYEFDPDGWSNPNTLCVDVLANGQMIHITNHHQCLSDGPNGELVFNLEQFFGGNVPSTIEVRAELVPSVAGETKDTRSTTITTKVDCPPPGQVPLP